MEVLSGVEGKFMLSSYPSDVLSDYTKRHGWHTINIDMTRSAGGGNKREVLTMNYATYVDKQLSLF